MALQLLVSETQTPPPLQQQHSKLHSTNIAQKPNSASFKNPKTITPSMSTYATLLDSCSSTFTGKQLHGHIVKTGFHSHDFVATKLLQMYSKFGSFLESKLLFDKMLLRSSFSWVAIINLHLQHSLFMEAFCLFRQLLFEDVVFDFFVFPVACKICSGLGLVELGRQLHGMVVKLGFFTNVYVGNALIDMYGKCGTLVDAKKVFDSMDETDSVSWNSIITASAANGMAFEALEWLEDMKRSDNARPNLVSWSALIGGFAQNGHHEKAIEVLYAMRNEGIEPTERTLASVLPSCARLEMLGLGKELHGYVMRHGFMLNPFVVNGLVDLYRRCGEMVSANQIFSKFSIKNAVSFNTMIVGYCENGEVDKAKELFDRMEHDGIERDLISWNSMISGYVDNFLFYEALKMLSDLLMLEGPEPDSFTLGSALVACSDIPDLRKGKEIHSYAIRRGLQSNAFVGGALVEMYSKCQDLLAAQVAFDEVGEKDVATWNVLISGYACCNHIDKIQNIIQKMKEDGHEPNVYTWNGILAGHVENGHLDLAMQLFTEMQASNLRPDIYTVGIILPACSRLSTLERGKQVHAYLIRCGYDSDVHIGAGLVDMYAKCGSVRYTKLVYDRISKPNLISHNAMLAAFAMHGLGEEGISHFWTLLPTSVRPDLITFLAALSSCVHAGSVKTGREIFNLMSFYDVNPTLKHYTAMVDLLSRSGQLREAYELIKQMPMEPDSVLWGALLGGCVIHGNVELGEIAAERLIELEPKNTGNYVMLANLYAIGKRWSDLARVRQTMKDRGMQKSPGCSWIEDKENIHAFIAFDRAHKSTDDIYSTLENLTRHMRTTALVVESL